MTWSFNLLAALVVVLTTSSCGPGDKLAPSVAVPREAAETLYTRGIQAIADQRYGEAIVLLDTLRNAYPESPYSKPANHALRDCVRLKLCSDARTVIRSGGGMTFFSNMPTKSPRHTRH